MDLLDTFKAFEYPNEIGPGVYDIHSPNVPSVEWMENLRRKAAHSILQARLWVIRAASENAWLDGDVPGAGE